MNWTKIKILLQDLKIRVKLIQNDDHQKIGF